MKPTTGRPTATGLSLPGLGNVTPGEVDGGIGMVPKPTGTGVGTGLVPAATGIIGGGGLSGTVQGGLNGGVSVAGVSVWGLGLHLGM